MKTRSKALRDYLSETGALDGTPEQIKHAKQAYRKLYKQNWKKQTRPRKEVRFELTHKQFLAVHLQATARGLRHTTYIKSLALKSIGELGATDAPLLQILQLVSMTVTAMQKNIPTTAIKTYVEQAEQQLLQYLNIKN